MATIEETIARINQRTAEIRARVGDTRSDQILGTEGRDRLFGTFGDDVIFGFGGDDVISGGFGDDFLDGGDGRDEISGGFGNDYILGGNGNDRLFGGAGDDLVFGGAGNDLIDGSIGSDVLFGGDGNDNITGGGNGDPNGPEEFFVDFLVGGNGSDTLNGFGGGTGTFERDVLIGGGEVDENGFIVDDSGDGVRDIFVLGNDRGPFYAVAGDDDYALILDFEIGIDQLQLSPTVNHAFIPDGGDTLIYANVATGPDLIGVLAGVTFNG